ncbi:MAG: hypothetical protein QXW97_03440 [Candidatus Pacearchaeota archaeon]
MINKRGQFYILAAIIIIVALTGLTTVSTIATTKPKPRNILSMNSELKEEGFRLIDYGLFINDPNKDFIYYLNNFIEVYYPNYFLKKTDKSNIIIVYGNKSDLYATQYETASIGNIRANIGSGNVNWGIVSNIVNRTKIINPTNPIIIEMLGNNHEFQLNDNPMFYFLIIQENEEGERYIQRE